MLELWYTNVRLIMLYFTDKAQIMHIFLYILQFLWLRYISGVYNHKFLNIQAVIWNYRRNVPVDS